MASFSRGEKPSYLALHFRVFHRFPEKLTGKRVESNETANEGRCIFVVVFSPYLYFRRFLSKVGALMHRVMLSYVVCTCITLCGLVTFPYVSLPTK